MYGIKWKRPKGYWRNIKDERNKKPLLFKTKTEAGTWIGIESTQFESDEIIFKVVEWK